MKNNPKSASGFTLMELLIVIAILAMLVGVVYTNWNTQIKKATDARRKGDLYRLKVVLENYLNDHGCYPGQLQMQSCGTANNLFVHYDMPSVPCEQGKIAYHYSLINPGNACAGYRLYTVLQDKTDLDIVKIGCDPTHGCNVAGHPEYNYGVSMGGTVAQ
jgi:prepilin-type N-terminal cleavage/methylation domain-containing protein